MIVLFGYNLRELNDAETEVLARRRMPRYPLEEIKGSGAREAAAVLLARSRAGRSGSLCT